MKIAIVHNDYGKFSGEEAVVKDHGQLLKCHGCSVVEFRRSSAELHGLGGAIKGFLCGILNPFSRRRFARFLDQELPDVIHIHNLYPLINPGILPEAKLRRIPVVMTMHNFRLFCPNGLFLVNNTICERCAQQKSVIPCLQNNCMHSRFKTAGYALRTSMAQRQRWYLDCVDRFLCLTEFQREKLSHYGIPPEKCRIVPNFINDAWRNQAISAPRGSGDYVAYMGRLSEEKGIDILLAAARALPEIPFFLAGNGAEEYRALAPPNVKFAGYLTEQEQFEFMRNARVQLMTSRCYENFPTTLLKGMSLGIPAVVPAIGGMPEIIRGAGESYGPDQLSSLLRELYFNEERLMKYRTGAMRRINDFTADACWQALRDSYAF